MLNTVNYNKGNKDCIVALVLSCPGTEEEKSGILVSGQTGENLNKVLQHLSRNLSDVFHSANRYDYRITNASNIVHPNATDPKRTPSTSEIKQPSNLQRLYEEIKDFKYVLSFGDDANTAVEECLKNNSKKPIHIHYQYHLGSMGINHIQNDEFGNPIITIKNDKKQAKSNNEKRLKVVSNTIIDLFQKQSKST